MREREREGESKRVRERVNEGESKCENEGLRVALSVLP